MVHPLMLGKKGRTSLYKIMVVEDDQKMREIILENIVRWGFDGYYVQDLNHVFDEFAKFDPHLILMDINLTAFDGFYWCSKIREVSKVPIIFISSRNSNMDIIMAINMGGDDFIQKPFSLDVLIAKINALLRRTYNYTNTYSNIIEHKGVVLNLKDNTVIFHDEKLELTKNEFKILYTLMMDKGEIVSRDHIMRALWEDESFVDDNTLTVNINRLRKKLEDIGLIDYIQTKKGQGYVIL
jgi:DNA-binding response OmpR family regulator